MNDQNARGQDVWGLSASTLMSTTTAEYKNLDEVRADKGRLQQMPEEEYKALLKKADHQIEVVIDKLRSGQKPTRTTALKSGRSMAIFCCGPRRAARQPQRSARHLQKKATSLVMTQPR